MLRKHTKYDDLVRRCQIQSGTSSHCRDEERKDVWVGIELVDDAHPFRLRRRAVQTNKANS